MTADEVKAELRRYRRVCDERQRLQKRVEDKRADMNYLQAVVSSGMPNGSGISDTVGRAIELMDGLINIYLLKVIECEKAETHVLNMLERLPDSLGRSILELKYIDGIDFDDIPERLYISDRTMWNYYNAAINKLCSELQ